MDFVQRVHKGYLDGYLLHRTCVFKAICLFIFPNFPGPTFIPEARVHYDVVGSRISSQSVQNILM